MNVWLRRSAPLWAIFVAALVIFCWAGGTLEHQSWLSQVLPVCIVVSAIFILALLREHKTGWAWRELPLGYRFKVVGLVAAYFILGQAAAAEVNRFLLPQFEAIYATYFWTTTAAILLITLGLAATDIAQGKNYGNGIRRAIMGLLIILGIASMPLTPTWTANSSGIHQIATVAYVVWALPLLLFYLEMFPFKRWRIRRRGADVA